MLTELRINFKRYFLLTGLSTALILIFSQNLNEVIGTLVVYVAACVNQFMLVRFVRGFFTPAIAGQRQNIDKGEVLSLFIVKIFVLVIGLTLGVLFMGNRVIFPVINYVFQMFALVYSLRDSSIAAAVRP